MKVQRQAFVVLVALNSRVMPVLTQKIKDQRKDDANDYGRHDGKVEDEFAAPTFVLDVSRQQG